MSRSPPTAHFDYYLAKRCGGDILPCSLEDAADIDDWYSNGNLVGTFVHKTWLYFISGSNRIFTEYYSLPEQVSLNHMFQGNDFLIN